MAAGRVKFLADRMLGKLAKYLLMLGFDTLYFTQKDYPHLIELAKKEGRVVLSRDTKLMTIQELPEHLFITDDVPKNQLQQVVNHFGLKIDEVELFSRCLRCNRKLITKTPEEVRPIVPPYIFTVHREFSSCPQCERVYWRGTHHQRMEEMLRRVITNQ